MNVTTAGIMTAGATTKGLMKEDHTANAMTARNPKSMVTSVSIGTATANTARTLNAMKEVHDGHAIAGTVHVHAANQFN